VNAAPQSNSIRRRVIYHGRVQGVFFRATSYDLARNYRVVGWVRNRPDGTVELEAEGEPTEVDRFLAAIAGHFGRHIANTNVSDIPPSGDQSDFRIRY
jgi:acylphosphatase